MPGPLAGLTVVDCTQGWAGPFAGMQLGDLGANVIKVEPPGGDFTRQLGPPFFAGESLPFLAINRSKRSIVLDLQNERGRAVLRDLVRDADVVIESSSPGEADRLGIGYDALRADHPGLIYGTVTPFGQDGPYRDLAGSELTTQTIAGWTAYFGESGGNPVVMGGDQASLYAGKYLTIGLLAALQHRRATGTGQRVDASLLGGLVGQPMAYVMDTFQFTEEELRERANLPGAVAALAGAGMPQRGIRTKDMAIDFTFYVNGYVPNDAAWMAFFHDINAPELAEDPRFRTNADRVAHKPELDAALERVLSGFGVYEVMDKILAHGGMASPYHTLAAMRDHPQTRANEMIVTVDHPTVGKLEMIGMPSWFHDTTAQIVLPPPTLGQHSVQVLQDLGYTQDRIEALLVSVVVG